MKKLLTVLVSATLFANAASAATDLIDVFHQAQTSDPAYKQARSTYLSAKTTVTQSRAALLPNLSLTGTWNQNRVQQSTDAGFSSSANSFDKNTTNLTQTELTATLTQPLFNWQAFEAYKQIKFTVKQAAAVYADAEQTLIMDTANAYFAVLQEQDVLRYTAAQRRELKRQLEVTEQRYHVGLDAVTAVYDARAQYDSMRATYIATENELANKKEELRQITGKLYPSLAGLKNNFPLVKPNPANINQWTQAAQEQNLSLLAARYAVQAAHMNIEQNFGQHLPTLNFNGTYNQKNVDHKDPRAGQDTNTTGYGLELDVPIYSGGGVSAQVKQAQYDYETAVAQMEGTHRQVVADARKAYLGVIAEISQIQADRQAIRSARAALASNRAAYKVGTQTILDVLTAQSTLYQAETTYAQDRFNYVINTLTLKQAVGTLTVADIEQVNKWLVQTDMVARPRRTTHKSPAKKA